MNTKINWLTGLVVVLIIANIALLATIWLKKDDKKLAIGNRPEARNFLVQQLELDNGQVAQFDSLRVGHFERIRQYRDQMRELKDNLFGQLKNSDQAAADSIAQQIGRLQTQIEIETFSHFSKLRQLLHPDQTKNFDNTIQELLRTIGPGPEGRLGPPPPGGPPDGRPHPPPPDGPPQ